MQIFIIIRSESIKIWLFSGIKKLVKTCFAMSRNRGKREPRIQQGNKDNNNNNFFDTYDEQYLLIFHHSYWCNNIFGTHWSSSDLPSKFDWFLFPKNMSGAHITSEITPLSSNNSNQPSIFEVIAQESLSKGLSSAFNHLVQVYIVLILIISLYQSYNLHFRWLHQAIHESMDG